MGESLISSEWSLIPYPTKQGVKGQLLLASLHAADLYRLQHLAGWTQCLEIQVVGLIVLDHGHCYV
jgi:hypothetical protein